MLEKFSIYMTSLQQERIVRVYVPENYHNETKRYPVLYMHDGQNVFEDEGSIGGTSLGLKDYLDKTGLEIIVVGIDQNSVGDGRVNDYCPWPHGKLSEEILGYLSPSGGNGEAYLDFIVDELKPFIDRKYRTIETETAMAGISLGALITTYAACRYPHIFRKIAVLSTAYYRNQEAIEAFIEESDLDGIEKFYMDIGTKEVPEDLAASLLFMELSRKVYGLLSSKIDGIRFAEIIDAEHHYRFFRERIPGILSYLFDDVDSRK
ncbi:alpha/beta hydrolase [Neobacillus niacini]|uniref:alpha/beta hydrolase n=1 Tax=Neobacillus niacini TaxID=86668 RepID=UPI0021CAEE89|nr:alpha/beta hydrolase-fold protein [Neobacillus niacini]MCM3765167.1 alpha/beta hydrolase-fold protein [Neobacillus niacini]